MRNQKKTIKKKPKQNKKLDKTIRNKNKNIKIDEELWH